MQVSSPEGVPEIVFSPYSLWNIYICFVGYWSFLLVISFDPYQDAIGKSCHYTYFTLEQTEIQKSCDFFQGGPTGKWDKLRIQLQFFSFQISYAFFFFFLDSILLF